jgi:hypothetical protein
VRDDVSELTAAMQAALDSVDDDRHRRRDTPQSRPGGTTGVRLREDDALPPVTAYRREPQSLASALRDTYGPVVASVWTTVREGLLLLVLFWVSALLLAFLGVDGSIDVPGVGEAAVITVSLVTAVALRGVFAAAVRASRASGPGRR